MAEKRTEQELRALLDAKMWELIHLCDEIQVNTPAAGMGEDENHILRFVQRLRRAEFGLLEDLHTGRRTVDVLTKDSSSEKEDMKRMFQSLVPALRAWLFEEVSKAADDFDLAVGSKDTLHALMGQLKDG